DEEVVGDGTRGAGGAGVGDAVRVRLGLEGDVAVVVADVALPRGAAAVDEEGVGAGAGGAVQERPTAAGLGVLAFVVGGVLRAAVAEDGLGGRERVGPLCATLAEEDDVGVAVVGDVGGRRVGRIPRLGERGALEAGIPEGVRRVHRAGRVVVLVVVVTLDG